MANWSRKQVWDYILEHELPYARSLKADSIDEVISRSDVLVVANAADEFREVPGKMREDQTLVDLVRIVRDRAETRGAYVGIAW